MTLKKRFADLKKVPKNVKRYAKRELIETDDFISKIIVNLRRKKRKGKKKTAKKTGRKTLNWVFCLVLILIVAIFLAIEAGYYLYYHKYAPAVSKVTPKKNTTIVRVGLYGNIDTPEIVPRQLRVQKSNIIVLCPPKEPVRKINFRGKAYFISLTEIFTFTIPGQQGQYWLADTSLPTVFKCPQDGYIKFNISYPSLFADFFTFVKSEQGYKMAPIEVRLVKAKAKPKDCASPRQIVRPRGFIGGLLPGLEIEKLERKFNLQLEARKGFTKIVESLKGGI